MDPAGRVPWLPSPPLATRYMIGVEMRRENVDDVCPHVDGDVQVVDLGVSSSAPFSVTHTFAASSHLHHDTIVVTALDDEGVHSAAQTFDVIV